jgi:hypothetical protein
MSAPGKDAGYVAIDANRQLAFPVPAFPAASRPDPWAAELKPFRPYRYRGLGYDIYLDNEEDSDGDS